MGDEELKHVGDAEEKHKETHKEHRGEKVICCSEAHSGECCCAEE